MGDGGIDLVMVTYDWTEARYRGHGVVAIGRGGGINIQTNQASQCWACGEG